MAIKLKNKKSEIFLDAAYAIALAVPKDSYHEKALAIADRVESSSMQIITTRSVVLEIGNALSKQRYRKAARDLLQSLEEDASVEIIPLSENLYHRAFRLYSERDDKEWGLTDCISFVVMEERKITEALTSDEHFRQAGFQALLLENF